MKSLIEYTDYSCLDDYESEIISNSYIRIENNIVELFTNGKLIANKDIFSIIDNPGNAMLGDENSFTIDDNCPISDFLFNYNDDIRQEIVDILNRNYRRNTEEEYKYLEGWEYETGIYYFSIKDGIIKVKCTNDEITYSDKLSKMFFIFDEEEIVTFIPSEYKNDRIDMIHDYIYYTGSKTHNNLFKYYFKQKKTLNRREVIDEIIG